MASQQTQGVIAKNEEPAKKKEKKEKEKTAQKIAKEMEKWAKRMNSQKDAPLTVPKAEQTTVSAAFYFSRYIIMLSVYCGFIASIVLCGD